MSDTDGTIKLGVDLSPEDAIAQAKKLGKELHNALANADFTKLDSQHQKLFKSMESVKKSASKITEEVEKLQNKKLRTEEYQLLNTILDEQKQKLKEAEQAVENLRQQHVSPLSEEFINAQAAVGGLNGAIEDTIKEMDALSEEGSTVFTADDQTRLDSYTEELEEINNKSASLITAFGKTEKSASNVGKRFQALANQGKQLVISFVKVGEALLRIAGFGPVIDGIKNKVSGLVSKLKGGATAATKFGDAFKHGVKKLFAYGLGIASLTSLFSKLRGAVTYGLNAMANMNGGVNSTNQYLTQLTSSLNLLKGSLATAFTPILQVVAPILSNLMQKLAGAINYIGMFIAKLTGAKSYMKATFKETNYAGGSSSGKSKQSQEDKYNKAVVKAQEKYDKELTKTQEKNAKAVAKAEEKEAKAADKLAKAQKKANDQLSGLDKLNTIDTVEDTTEALQDYEAELAKEPELNLPNPEDYMDGGGSGSGDPFGLEEVMLDNLEWDWGEIQRKAEQLGRDLADKLNNIFADEDFAKNIGKNIAEALNTVIDFIYGFVDQFNWKQAGKWLGTLIQEGIETFDWDQAGETLGKLINGLADWIIGFFEGYQVGSLGQAIADFLNKAIETVDPDKLGEAVVDVLKSGLIELKQFLTETNWKEAGKKFSDFLHKVFTSDELDDKTLGQDVGELLKAIVDAAIEFLSGMDKSQLIADIGKFFGDIFASSGVEGQIVAAIVGWNIIDKVFGIGGVGGLIKGTGKLIDLFTGASNAADAAGKAAGAAKTAGKVASSGAKAVEGAAEGAAGAASGAATAATAALGVFDAAMVAYDVGKLVEVHDEWETADDEHQKAVENYCDSLETLYSTAGKKAVDAYAGKEVDMKALYKEWEEATGTHKTQLGDTLAEYSKIYEDAGNEAVSAVAGTNTTLQEEQEKARKQYEEMPHNMWEGFIGGWNDYFGEDGKGLGQLASDAFSEMVSTIKGLLKIGSPSKVMEEIGDDTVEGLENGLTFDSLLTEVQTSINSLIKKFETNFTGSKLLSMGTSLITGLKSGMSKEFSTTLSIVQTKSTEIFNKFASNLNGNKLVSIGINLINGLKSGLTSGLNSAISTVNSVCNTITSTVKKAFQIHSPSKVFEDIGENLMLGLAEGADEKADAVDASFENLVPSQSILDVFKDQFISTIVNMTDTAKGLFDDMMQYFETSMLSVNLASALKDMPTSLPNLSQIKIPDIAMGYKLPSNKEFTNASSNDISNLSDVIKKAVVEALTETSVLKSDDDTTTIINIDGKQVFQAVRRENSQYKKQHGESAFA